MSVEPFPLAPVRTLADLNSLDQAEVLSGYEDGRRGDPAPGHNRSRSYWHGWRNGAVDAGHREKDDHQQALAAELIAEAKAIRLNEEPAA